MSCRFLIVIPDPVARAALRRTFADWDGEFFECSSGREALVFLQGHEVDLIFVEHQMSEMNGLEFLRYARMVRPDALCIMLIAHTIDLGLVIEAINEGVVYRFVVKPWDAFDLRVMIKLAIRHLASLRAAAAREK